MRSTYGKITYAYRTYVIGKNKYLSYARSHLVAHHSSLCGIEGGVLLLPRIFFNFWVSNCIFWCILGATLSATVLNSTGRLGGMAPSPKSAYVY